MDYPRVLVISNNSFSKTDSNGRTLGNFFMGWPKERLAQFCVSSDGADFDVCDNYRCITDGEVINARKHFRKAQPVDLVHTSQVHNIGSRGKERKTAFLMLCRSLLWHDDIWKTKQLHDWIDKFNPDIVLVMFSDSTFILEMATFISKMRRIPLMMYNSEGYYFFKHNYFRTKTWCDWLWFPIYQRVYKKQVERTMRRVSFSIYCNDLLQNDYNLRFSGPSAVLYTSSTLKFESHLFDADKPVFSYMGNLTFNRPKALMEVADVLQSINPSYKLDVYGKPMDKEMEETLINYPGISFKGFVSYEEVQKVIRKSDILFHAETRDKRWEESLRYGFSTKIADSVSSGTCFLLYAPSYIACAQYIKETNSGWFADNKSDLRKAIEDILFNEGKRNEVLFNAQVVAVKNHSLSNNCQIFRQLVCECLNNNKDNA